jgi:hypothetical protein
MISPSHKPLTTQHTTDTTDEQSHRSFSGIRTGNPSNQASVYLRLLPHGHLEWPRYIYEIWNLCYKWNVGYGPKEITYRMSILQSDTWIEIMYMCMYVYMYVCMNVCIYVWCLYVRIYVCLRLRTHTRTLARMRVYMYACMYSYVFMCICISMYWYVCTYVYMYLSMYICVYVFGFVYKCLCI